MKLLEATAPPGSLAWLVLHEVRLTFRAGRRRGFAKWVRIVLLGAFLVGGILAAWRLRATPLTPHPEWLVIGSATLLVLLTFMTTQALMAALRTLFERSDLDLLLSSPLPEGRVLAAKMLGLAAGVAVTYFLLLLPLATPVAIWGHPRLLALVPVLAALAMVSASLGLMLAVLLVRRIGARAAKALGQVVAAGLGGSIYLISQLAGHNRPGHGRIMGIANWLREGGWGVRGWSAAPAHALFGDVVPLAGLLLVSGTLFAFTSWLFRTRFLAGYQSGGETARPARATGRGPAFEGGLLRIVLAKEIRLLLREPDIMFMMLLRCIYLFPLLLIGSRGGPASVALAASSLSAVGVIAGGQLCGSVAWLTISAEDAPDLLAVSPVASTELKRIKLLAAMIMVSPIALLFPGLIVWRGHPAAAAITFAGTIVAGAGAGMVELLLGKPAKRAAMARRRQGSLLTSLVGLFLALVVAAMTAVAVFFVQR
jgi:ABC-2 type transport system permease protein